MHVALELEGGLGISLIEDVTGRHDLEEQLRQAQKMEAIGQLAGGVAHDFNNLLTVVIGGIDLLQRQAEGANRKTHRGCCDPRVGRPRAELSRQLLAFRPASLLPTPTSISGPSKSCAGATAPHVLGDVERWRPSLLGARWPVRADPAQLEQVVVNLVVNARDAMPDGGADPIETATRPWTRLRS